MNRKTLVPCFLMLFFLVSSVVVSEVAAAWLPPADTDVCWSDFSGSTLRLRFVNVGGGYYQIVGRRTDAGESTKAIFGSAIVTAPNLLISMTLSAATYYFFWTEASRMVLNRTNLGLSVKTMVLKHDMWNPVPDTVSYKPEYSMGHITCP